MPSAYMIYNPIAGRYPSGILTERAANLLRKEGWDIQLEQTHSADHLAELASQAVADSVDALFVVGGDGSLNNALPALMNTNTALGVLPAGTANVWAQELGLPGLTWTRIMALVESARILAHPQIRKVDIGLCGQRPFLLWSGIGFELLSGNHKKSDQVTLVGFRSLVLKSKSTLYVQVDGEPAEANEPLHIRVCPQALKVLVPEHTPHPLFGSYT